VILIGKRPQSLGNRAAKTCREMDRRQRIADLRIKTARLGRQSFAAFMFNRLSGRGGQAEAAC
jgi:hypothetical protein